MTIIVQATGALTGMHSVSTLRFVFTRENPFSSATIEIAQNQTVVSTGPYAMVRRPMYFVGLWCSPGTPLALGSYWGLLAFGVAFPALAWRLLDEEKFLSANLR